MENACKNRDIDKQDIMVSLSSGVITASIDCLWVKDIDLFEAHKWGTDKINDFVMKVAFPDDDIRIKKDLQAAIKELGNNKIEGELLANEFGGGAYPHLRDFSHHPTPVGLIFSILMQLTGKGYGTDSAGNFVMYPIPNWTERGFEEAIYLGTVVWFMHLISDASGTLTNFTKGNEGRGLPGPMLSVLKEISSLPIIKELLGKSKNSVSDKEDNYTLSDFCARLFTNALLGEQDENGQIIKDGTLHFDLRTELGIGIGIVKESMNKKQYIPVLLNELIVASFYSVKRIIMEINEQRIYDLKEIERIDIRKCLPWADSSFKHMRLMAATMFSLIDFSVSGIKAAIKNKGNSKGFARDFLQGINYWGIGDFTLAVCAETNVGIENLYKEFVSIIEKQKQNFFEKCPNGEEVLHTAEVVASLAGAMMKVGTPLGYASAAIGVFVLIRDSAKELKMAKEERIRVEEECNLKIRIIQENREEMEMMVSDYLYNKTLIIVSALEKMDKAITENDIEEYIAGNNMIQRDLSGEVLFENYDEFHKMMISDLPVKF